MELQQLANNLLQQYPALIVNFKHDELTVEVLPNDLFTIAKILKTSPYYFEQLIDLAGVDYLHYPIRITYCGRLDKDSEGLVIMTNDGELLNQMMRAKNQHEKEYVASLDKSITEEFYLPHVCHFCLFPVHLQEQFPLNEWRQMV